MSDLKPVRRTGTSLEPVGIGEPEGLANPTKLVPVECRADLGRLWACNAHLFPNQLPLFATVRDYLDQGLPPEAVPHIVRLLLRADRRANHRYAADLLTDLAGLVADELHRRRIVQASAERRARHLAEVENACLGGDIHDLIAAAREAAPEDDDAA